MEIFYEIFRSVRLLLVHVMILFLTRKTRRLRTDVCMNIYLYSSTKLQEFANFWSQKMLQLFITPVFSRFISLRLFSVPQVENEIKRTPLCGCCWDPKSRNWSIKEVPKRGIFGCFSETVRPHKSLYICQWSLFWI